MSNWDFFLGSKIIKKTCVSCCLFLRTLRKIFFVPLSLEGVRDNFRWNIHILFFMEHGTWNMFKATERKRKHVGTW